MKNQLFASAVILTTLAAPRSDAQAPASPAAASQAPVRSPFDKDDPEIQAILKLNWKSVEFNQLDPRTRCLAFLALSKGLGTIGAKADARLDLLMDFIDEKMLGESLAKNMLAIPDLPAVTFDDMKKVGAAWVQSPAGKQKVASELQGVADDSLAPYMKMYERTAQRTFEEALESRLQVRVMAVFLEKQGKLEEFKKWAEEEKKRRVAERRAEAAQQRATAAEAERQRREDALEAAEHKRREDAQLAAMRMELAAQQQAAEPVAPQLPVDNPQFWDDDDDYWAYPYYYTNAYRGEIRDRLEDAWGRWQNNPRPTPYRGGGRSGGRGGGRR